MPPRGSTAAAAAGGDGGHKRRSRNGNVKEKEAAMADLTCTPAPSEGQASGIKSIGSIGHPHSCTPCTIHCYSLGSCNMGNACLFCHMDHAPSDRRRSSWARKTHQQHFRRYETEPAGSSSNAASGTSAAAGPGGNAGGTTATAMMTPTMSLDVMEQRSLSEHCPRPTSADDALVGARRSHQRLLDLLDTVGDSADLSPHYQKLAKAQWSRRQSPTDDGGGSIGLESSVGAGLDEEMAQEDQADLKEAPPVATVLPLCEEVRSLVFSLGIADPSMPGCPLIVCSKGLTDFTGLSSKEVTGKTWMQLLEGLGQKKDEEDGGNTAMAAESEVAAMANWRECQELFDAASRGDYLPKSDRSTLGAGAAGSATPIAQQLHFQSLPDGELVCLLSRGGKLLHLKQVELDENMYIIGLLARLSEDGGDNTAAAVPTDVTMEEAWPALDKNMARALQVLASQFWYSAPMRRQAVDDDEQRG